MLNMLKKYRKQLMYKYLYGGKLNFIQTFLAENEVNRALVKLNLVK
jgi:hypothetical protein